MPWDSATSGAIRALLQLVPPTARIVHEDAFVNAVAVLIIPLPD